MYQMCIQTINLSFCLLNILSHNNEQKQQEYPPALSKWACYFLVSNGKRLCTVSRVSQCSERGTLSSHIIKAFRSSIILQTMKDTTASHVLSYRIQLQSSSIFRFLKYSCLWFSHFVELETSELFDWIVILLWTVLFINAATVNMYRLIWYS